jgi:hypothetical protein
MLHRQGCIFLESQDPMNLAGQGYCRRLHAIDGGRQLNDLRRALRNCRSSQQSSVKPSGDWQKPLNSRVKLHA